MGAASMLTSILGGLGLFLLGMAVMTDGLKALAGSALRVVLARAASTPARGTFWGTVVTLLIQSSSATTMTTIGLVSAGLLTFPQALGVVFGANVGTSGTGWLVALLGVKVSLNAAAMPMLFAGALLRLMGRGRWAAGGGALAGFALLLLGLTVLQVGMAGLAERLRPEDLPAVGGSGPWATAGGLLTLVVIGIVMTTVMQSSSAAVAATISALHAGAIGPEQAGSLVIGQNIGSAVSSALAAIGATTPAKRTALAHVLFNVITGVIVLAAFPILAPLFGRWSASVEPTILLAAFHTGYNMLGVAVLLPAVGPFSRAVERMLPQRGSQLTQFLDDSVLDVPAVAVEAARRSVARSLRTLCVAVVDGLTRARAGDGRGPHAGGSDDDRIRQADEALDQTRNFLSRLTKPPASAAERARLEGVLHALDHASRMAETAAEEGWRRPSYAGGDEAEAADACAAALRVATRIASLAAGESGAAPPGAPAPRDETDLAGAVADLSRRAEMLAALRRAHRARALAIDADSPTRAGEALARVEAVRLVDRLVYHAWRSAARLASSGARLRAAD